MTKRILTLSALAMGLGAMVGVTPHAAAQQRGGAVPAPARGARGATPATTPAAPAAAPAPAKTPYTPPKTAWGEPDLQGMWPLTHLISTNFQRDTRYGDRRFLTDQEFATAEASAQARAERYQSGAVPAADGGGASHLTSLMSDPPNGRFPELTATGKEMSDKMYGSYKPRKVNGADIFDSPDDFDTWDRCITRGMPVSMLTRNYNVGIRVMQSPGYVIILLEMAHEARIIPTDGRPFLDPVIKTYLGESRGHWEGNTLVVETKNFNGKPAMTNLGVPGSPALTPASESLHITEWFTRTGPETVEYKMTVEDPVVLTRPWSVEFPWQLDPAYDMYEYACHEGNTAIRNYIETNRFERANPRPAAPAGGARGGRGGGGAAPGGPGGARGGRGGGAAVPPGGN
ncbi:MAG TPA: hypothetical protein VFY29_00665 [Terriglobia bacterium]|nr:hypothetical protein [Terriglobia bacterium]